MQNTVHVFVIHTYFFRKIHTEYHTLCWTLLWSTYAMYSRRTGISLTIVDWVRATVGTRASYVLLL